MIVYWDELQTTQCHSKQASEFAFAGSSSLLATGGQSSDGRNVCLWDTLLPQRKAMIGSFHCHEHGCSALLYAPHSGLLISAGKKGDIGMYSHPVLYIHTCIYQIAWRQARMCVAYKISVNKKGPYKISISIVSRFASSPFVRIMVMRNCFRDI